MAILIAHYSTEDLIARARGSNNVIALGANSDSQQISAATSASDDSQDRVPSVYQRFPRRRPVWIVAAISMCVVGSVGLYFYAERNQAFETGIGEQRFVKLVDGSTIELNSRSRVRIRYSNLGRDVDLIEGQALFHVAKDAARPFIVHSGTTLVRAVGTQFDVYRKDSGTTVTVVEGRVAVLSPILAAEHEGGQSGSAAAPRGSMPAPIQAAKPLPPAGLPGKSGGSVALDAALSIAPDAIFLSAGEQITVSAQAKSSPTHTDPTVVTAWTQHELVFDSTSLVEVAQEFNRYNARQLIINDAALANFHITGVFSSADPASLLKFLRAQRDIQVEETADGIHVSKK